MRNHLGLGLGLGLSAHRRLTPRPQASTRNLTRLVAELDQLERRQSSLLQVLDAHATGSLGTGPDTPLDAVRTTMRKLPQVSGWGVYCCDFLLLPTTSCCS